MRYQASADFRAALEQRLANQAAESGMRVDRLRRLAVFERILARLVVADPEMWILKGGVALEMRWPAHARTTNDLDLATRLQPVDGVELREHLDDVLSKDPDGDGFTFVVAPPKPLQTDEAGRPGWRFSVQSRLAGREFASVTLDIVQRMEEIIETDRLSAPNFFAFAEILGREVEAVSPAQHFAEKLHALTRDYGRENTRVRDLVDLALIIERADLALAAAFAATNAVFRARGTHEVPLVIPDPSAMWAGPYERLALDVGIQAKSLAAAMSLLRTFWAAALTTTQEE